MKKNGKRYQECEKLIDKSKVYPVAEAIELLEKMPKAKFDETVELHVKLGVDLNMLINKLEVLQYFQMEQVKL